MLDLTGTGGAFDRKPDSTHVVSMWYVPSGTDYTAAKPITVYFSDGKQAETFTRSWENLPEMALCLDIGHHDMISENIQRSHPCHVCGQPRNSHIDRIDAFPGQCDSWTEGPLDVEQIVG